jgi:ABC-type uncharacterized transport system substrate-binding protein
VTFASNVSESKRLGLLHAAVPAAIVIGKLMNPDNASSEVQLGDLSKAAGALGLKLEIAKARRAYRETRAKLATVTSPSVM